MKEKESPSVLGKGLGCPIGTVPIRRTQKEDLIRAQAFSKLRTRRYAENSHPLAPESNVFRVIWDLNFYHWWCLFFG